RRAPRAVRRRCRRAQADRARRPARVSEARACGTGFRYRHDRVAYLRRARGVRRGLRARAVTARVAVRGGARSPFGARPLGSPAGRALGGTPRPPRPPRARSAAPFGPRTMTALDVFAIAAAAPGLVALITPERAFTYAELAERCEGAARALAALGAIPGQRPVALVLRPTVASLVPLLALIAYGVPVLLLHPRLPTADRAALAHRAGAVAVLT